MTAGMNACNFHYWLYDDRKRFDMHRMYDELLGHTQLQLPVITPDILAQLHFPLYEHVYEAAVDDTKFPQETNEHDSYFIGISDHVGYVWIYKIVATTDHIWSAMFVASCHTSATRPATRHSTTVARPATRPFLLNIRPCHKCHMPQRQRFFTYSLRTVGVKRSL